MSGGKYDTSISEMIKRFRTERPTSREERNSLREKGKLQELWFQSDSPKTHRQRKNNENDAMRQLSDDTIAEKVNNQVEKYARLRRISHSRSPMKRRGKPTGEYLPRSPSPSKAKWSRSNQESPLYVPPPKPVRVAQNEDTWGQTSQTRKTSIVDRLIMEDIERQMAESLHKYPTPASPVLSPPRSRWKSPGQERRTRSRSPPRSSQPESLSTLSRQPYFANSPPRGYSPPVKSPMLDRLPLERLSGPVPPPPSGPPPESPPKSPAKIQMHPSLLQTSTESSLMGYDDLLQMRDAEGASPAGKHQRKRSAPPNSNEVLTYDDLEEDSIGDGKDDLFAGVRAANDLLERLRPNLEMSLLPKQVQMDPLLTFRKEGIETSNKPEEGSSDGDDLRDLAIKTMNIQEQMTATMAHLADRFGSPDPMSPLDRYRFQESFESVGDLPNALSKIEEQLDAALLPFKAREEEEKLKEKEAQEIEERIREEVRTEMRQEVLESELNRLTITPKDGERASFLRESEDFANCYDQAVAESMQQLNSNLADRLKMIQEIEFGTSVPELELRTETKESTDDRELDSSSTNIAPASLQFPPPHYDIQRSSLPSTQPTQIGAEQQGEIQRMSLPASAKLYGKATTEKRLEDVPRELDATMLTLQKRLQVDKSDLDQDIVKDIPEEKEDEENQDNGDDPLPEPTPEQDAEKLFALDLDDPLVHVPVVGVACNDGRICPQHIQFPVSQGCPQGVYVPYSEAHQQATQQAASMPPEPCQNSLCNLPHQTVCAHSPQCNNCVFLDPVMPEPSAPLQHRQSSDYRTFLAAAGTAQKFSNTGVPPVPGNTSQGLNTQGFPPPAPVLGDFTGASLQTARSRLQAFQQQRQRFLAQHVNVDQFPIPATRPSRHYTPQELKELRMQYTKNM